MKICVVGVGAIGSLFAFLLAKKDFDLSVLARGDNTLRAITEQGLTLRDPKLGEQQVAIPKVSADGRQLGEQDIVFLGVKAHQMGALLPQLAPLLHSQTVVIPVINGLPWWYFYREGGKQEGNPIHCLDPERRMFNDLAPSHILGCVIEGGAELISPGIIQANGVRIIYLGEPDGSISPRLNQVAKVLSESGFTVYPTPQIRLQIWNKLLGNISFNPLSALTYSNMTELCSDEDMVGLVRSLMQETSEVAKSYQTGNLISIEDRLKVAFNMGSFRPSMLQDVDRGRRLEVVPILGAVVELAGRASPHPIPVPIIQTVYTLIRARDRRLGLV